MASHEIVATPAHHQPRQQIATPRATVCTCRIQQQPPYPLPGDAIQDRLPHRLADHLTVIAPQPRGARRYQNVLQHLRVPAHPPNRGRPVPAPLGADPTHRIPRQDPRSRLPDLHGLRLPDRHPILLEPERPVTSARGPPPLSQLEMLAPGPLRLLLRLVACHRAHHPRLHTPCRRRQVIFTGDDRGDPQPCRFDEVDEPLDNLADRR